MPFKKKKKEKKKKRKKQQQMCEDVVILSYTIMHYIDEKRVQLISTLAHVNDPNKILSCAEAEYCHLENNHRIFSRVHATS